MKVLSLGICLLLLLLFSGFGLYAQEKEQYLILISLDGYRYDYTERFKPENLSRFIEQGTAAQAMIPSFPTKTFPNHYTIATGMLPENHGLVDNSFYEPEKDQVYSMGNRSIVEDGYWYGGTPIWVLAEQNGIKAASYFFVGSEAPIKGIRPSYYYSFDASVPNLTRISKVFEWLQLPEDERPRLITLYFSDMDDVGHRYGPENDEKLQESLDRLDHELGALFEGLKSFDLDINIIIVSDHGMTNVPKENLLNLDNITEGLEARVVNNGALAHVYLEEPGETDKVCQQINGQKGPYRAVKVQDLTYYKSPEKYKNRKGNILVMPDLGFYLATTKGMVTYQNRSAMFQTEVFGEHGYSPEFQDLHGIFYANGPAIKEGLRIPPFQNIHVYPLLCSILDLRAPDDIDGDFEVLEPVLRGK
ncbi:Predicted pyrophosphatase or phosphodiesterase, AlkP superfamily [Cyclobacterium lianum]|uniref:Predicted pyrophosphatase or phosphodiesterase, AlkP superfamily n=1 Tax=Cyclobacterium lianum TaxID=388280 RepID=A0A1M7QMB6_9BACT|nr:ectonucleotide pyrophosphatase/phosphodiesterase [Cyclobacterium lianum]SHN32560.1 Predicted pyrophosphatase or phosphodiesterase, AlkP superfamily [Cyclobacterium lianum]